MNDTSWASVVSFGIAHRCLQKASWVGKFVGIGWDTSVHATLLNLRGYAICDQARQTSTQLASEALFERDSSPKNRVQELDREVLYPQDNSRMRCDWSRRAHVRNACHS